MPAAEAEIALAWLLERHAGVEEAAHGDESELAVYTDEAGERVLRAAFRSVAATAVDAGWEDRWKEFHRPARAGGLWIGPPWLEPPAGEPAVVVDPGRAFGTGAHPTTRLCIEALAALARGSVVDAGCGSGVVAVAAVRLGFGPVHAVDVDPDAVEVARGTAAANGVAIEVRAADVLCGELPATDVLVANIELGVVEALLARSVAPRAVTSGYLVGDRVRPPGGWEHADRRELEGWAADVWAKRH